MLHHETVIPKCHKIYAILKPNNHIYCACKGIILLTQNLRFVSACVSVITLVALCSCKGILILAKGILITESLRIIKLSECSCLWFVHLFLKTKAKQNPHTSPRSQVCVQAGSPERWVGLYQPNLVGFGAEFVGLKESHPWLATYFLVVGAHVMWRVESHCHWQESTG